MPPTSELIIIASAKARPGKEKQLEQALRDAATPTRAQPGCITFSLYRSSEDPAVIIAFERWGSKRDHDRHLQGVHIQTLMSVMGNVLAESPKITAYEIVDEK